MTFEKKILKYFFNNEIKKKQFNMFLTMKFEKHFNAF